MNGVPAQTREELSDPYYDPFYKSVISFNYERTIIEAEIEEREEAQQNSIIARMLEELRENQELPAV